MYSQSTVCVIVIVESGFEKNKCLENLICTKKKRENDLFALAGGRRCIVVSIVCVLLYFNCGIVAIGKNLSGRRGRRRRRTLGRL